MAHDRATVKRLKELERDLNVSVSALAQYPRGKRKELLEEIKKNAASDAAALGLNADEVRAFVNRTCVMQTEEDDDTGLEVGFG